MFPDNFYNWYKLGQPDQKGVDQIPFLIEWLENELMFPHEQSDYLLEISEGYMFDMEISVCNRWRGLLVSPTFAVSIVPEPKVNVFVFSDYISPNFISVEGEEAKQLAYWLNQAIKSYYGLV